MIRCPFNNFTKCNADCPFSTDDMTRCDLQRSLAAIEGVARGIHSNAQAASNTAKQTSSIVGSIAQSASAMVVTVGKLAQSAESHAVAQTQLPIIEDKPEPMLAEQWVRERGIDWFDGRSTSQVWDAFVKACTDGRAIKKTQLLTSHKKGHTKPESGEPVNQRRLTAIVGRVFISLAIVRADENGNRCIFVRTNVNGGDAS